MLIENCVYDVISDNIIARNSATTIIYNHLKFFNAF